MSHQKRSARLAKLSRPRLYRATHRQRLYHLLDRGRTAAPCFCVVGPPGAGKTTVVATWLDVRQIDGIWYQVDSGDADLASFFHYLGLAAQPFAHAGEAPLPALTPEYLADIRGFARRFFRSLFERLPPDAALVLDNYQEVPSAEAFHEIIADAANEVPPGVCLIVVSRRDAPEPYARLILNERVTQITWDDLRLTIDEAYAISSARGARDRIELQRLHQESDGWAAGLTLLLERRAHGRAPVAGHHQKGPIFDYFASQVFDSLEPDLKDLLIKTSLSVTVHIPVAESLTGLAHAGSLLEDLYARRLFVHRRPGTEVTYQYHALFRDFLHKRLADEAKESDRWKLVVRTADLLSERTQLEEAIALYREAGAWAQAERLTVKLAPQLLSAGRWRSLQEWLTCLPQKQLTRSAEALYWLGLSRMQTSPSLAREDLTDANDLFSQNGDVRGRLLSASAIIRSYHFEYNTFEAMDHWIAQIQADLAKPLPLLDPADELSIHSAVLLVTTYRQPGNPCRQQSLQRVSTLLDAPVDVNQRMSAAFVLLLAHTQAHENSMARRLIGRLEALAGDVSLTALNRAYWWMLVGYFQHRDGDHTRTEEALSRADRIATENGLRQPEFLSRCFRAQHCCSWSDIAGAVRALDGLDKALSDTKPMATAQYHKQGFFLEMARGNAASADSHARLGVAAAARLGAPFFNVAWLSQGAAALVMNGAYADAASWLDTAWRLSELGFVKTYRPMVLASKAFLALRQGNKHEARSFLQELFSICPDEDAFSYVGTVPVVKDVVLIEALRAGISVPLVQSLIRKYAILPPRDDLDGWPWPIKVHTLGPFYIEIDGERVRYSRKTPRKVLLLLKALIAMGGQAVPQRRLIDTLWPDEDGDAAIEALGASLHRLRKLLGQAKAIEVKEGMLSIDRSRMWVDVWSLERQVSDGIFQQRREADDACAQRIVSLYRGHFLDEDTDLPCAIAPRERARDQYLRYLLVAGQRLESAADFEGAAALYRSGIHADELAEDLYQGLMRALGAAGRTADALGVYRRLSHLMGDTLGIKPSASTRRLFERLQQQT